MSPDDHFLEALRELVREVVREELAKPRHEPKPLLSVAQATEAFGLSESTIHRMMNRGELRHMRVGRRILIPADALTNGRIGALADRGRWP